MPCGPVLRDRLVDERCGSGQPGLERADRGDQLGAVLAQAPQCPRRGPRSPRPRCAPSVGAERRASPPAASASPASSSRLARTVGAVLPPARASARRVRPARRQVRRAPGRRRRRLADADQLDRADDLAAGTRGQGEHAAAPRPLGGAAGRLGRLARDHGLAETARAGDLRGERRAGRRDRARRERDPRRPAPAAPPDPRIVASAAAAATMSKRGAEIPGLRRSVPRPRPEPRRVAASLDDHAGKQYCLQSRKCPHRPPNQRSTSHPRRSIRARSSRTTVASARGAAREARAAERCQALERPVLGHPARARLRRRVPARRGLARGPDPLRRLTRASCSCAPGAAERAPGRLLPDRPRAHRAARQRGSKRDPVPAVGAVIGAGNGRPGIDELDEVGPRLIGRLHILGHADPFRRAGSDNFRPE